MLRIGHGKKSFSSSASSSVSSSFSSSSSSSFVSLQIKEDNKFFSKLLSREDSSLLDHINNSSNSSSKALYFGESQGSIPFTWESQPGTPKSPTVFPETYPVPDIAPDLIPPLTPPPCSYFSSSSVSSATPNSTNKSFLGRKQHNLSLSGVVSRVKNTSGGPRARSHTLPLNSAPSSSPSTWSASTTSRSSCEQRWSRSRLQFGLLPDVDIEDVYINDYDSNNNDDSHNVKKTDDHAGSSPDSTLKFSSRRKHRPSGNKLWACSPTAKVKRVFSSIVGHRPSSHHHAA
ncbi:hypothetical protein CDL15_Pgr025738 [Punica granatum]|uniref:Uncharacterized protein n=1 Tax=Punica granatum TaxID=22663 RepID=A0A218WBM2_PUNGR|nr:hypothetical protein CDL15_Pgr025738 [Punica granatum]PKI40605.1 hypothetical protein CRG98_039015 [Punica granatum]